jgi:hypothetical protein
LSIWEGPLGSLVVGLRDEYRLYYERARTTYREAMLEEHKEITPEIESAIDRAARRFARRSIIYDMRRPLGRALAAGVGLALTAWWFVTCG